MRYSEHLDVMTALVTYLALTARKSRTPRYLAADLSLPEDDVRAVFETFPGLFRESARTDSAGQHFYTLHARYALRADDDADDDGAELPGVRAEILKVLLDYIAQRAQSEQSRANLESELAGTRRNAQLAATAATAAAVLAFVAAFVS